MLLVSGRSRARDGASNAGAPPLFGFLLVGQKLPDWKVLANIAGMDAFGLTAGQLQLGGGRHHHDGVRFRSSPCYSARCGCARACGEFIVTGNVPPKEPVMRPPQHGQGYEDGWVSPSSAQPVSSGCRGGPGTLSNSRAAGDVVSPAAISEQAIMADAVEPAGQHVDEEAADELVDRECHHLAPLVLIGAVILPFESDAGIIEPDEATVVDGDTMGVARQISQDRLRAAEWPLRIDHHSALRSGARWSLNALGSASAA
jgi:hypothetical protein